MKLLQKQTVKIESSDSIVKFETTGGSDWKVWDRFISIEGKKAFHIGNICGTCNFFFERLEGANKKVSQKSVIETVGNQPVQIYSAAYFEIVKLIPAGKYRVFILNVHPRFVRVGTDADYFVKEEIETFGIDGFWGLPHHPKINYYREVDVEIDDKSKLFSFLIPIVPENWLDDETVMLYREKMGRGIVPTAIALSHIDIKEPADWDQGQKHTRHICFANYILDGHHKLFASAEAGKPLNLLSFVSIENSICSAGEIDEVEKILAMGS